MILSEIEEVQAGEKRHANSASDSASAIGPESMREPVGQRVPEPESVPRRRPVRRDDDHRDIVSP